MRGQGTQLRRHHPRVTESQEWTGGEGYRRAAGCGGRGLGKTSGLSDTKGCLAEVGGFPCERREHQASRNASALEITHKHPERGMRTGRRKRRSCVTVRTHALEPGESFHYRLRVHAPPAVLRSD